MIRIYCIKIHLLSIENYLKSNMCQGQVDKGIVVMINVSCQLGII